MRTLIPALLLTGCHANPQWGAEHLMVGSFAIDFADSEQHWWGVAFMDGDGTGGFDLTNASGVSVESFNTGLWYRTDGVELEVELDVGLRLFTGDRRAYTCAGALTLERAVILDGVLLDGFADDGTPSGDCWIAW